MALFYWSPCLETGNARIDAQHRRLFDLTNELDHRIGQGGLLPDVPQLVAELRDYAVKHFCDEEGLLACSALPPKLKDRHICAHRQFIARVEALAAQTDLGHGESAAMFLEFLVTWLVTHILKLDHRMVRALPSTARSAQSEEPISVERTLITALGEAERRFRLMSDVAPAMIWICGPTGRRDFINKAWRTFLDMPANQKASDFDWLAHVHPEDRQYYAAVMAGLLKEGDQTDVEYRVRVGEDAWAFVLERIVPRMDGETRVGLIASATDITLIKRSEVVLIEANRALEREVAARTHQLEMLVRTDPLTGLANRRMLTERLEAESERAAVFGHELSILYIDVDHFKQINDRFGHPAGDRALRLIADTLRARTRVFDTVARYGGEEFVVVMPGSDEAEARAVAERLRVAVEEIAFEPEPRLVHRLGVSIGIACRPAGVEGVSADSLVNAADRALYLAKQAGRNRVVMAQ